MCVCVSERESVVSENKNSPRKVSPKSSTTSAERKKTKTLTRSTPRSTHELYHTTATSSRLRGLARFARCAPFGSNVTAKKILVLRPSGNAASWIFSRSEMPLLLSSPAAAGVSGSQGRQSSHTNWSVPPDAPFLPRPDVVTGIVARSRPLSLSQPEPLPTSLWTTTEPVLASRVRLCEGPR